MEPSGKTPEIFSSSCEKSNPKSYRVNLFQNKVVTIAAIVTKIEPKLFAFSKKSSILRERFSDSSCIQGTEIRMDTFEKSSEQILFRDTSLLVMVL